MGPHSGEGGQTTAKASALRFPRPRWELALCYPGGEGRSERKETKTIKTTPRVGAHDSFFKIVSLYSDNCPGTHAMDRLDLNSQISTCLTLSPECWG